MFSQTVESALRAMVFLAANTSTPTSVQVIAAHARVPERSLSKVLRNLVVAGLVKSRRGPTGGFLLSRPSRDISMLSVVEAVEALPRITKCPLDNPKHVGLCPMHRRLNASYALIARVLGQCSLQEVAAEASPDDCSGVLTTQVALAAAVEECGATCAGGCKNLNNGLSHAHDHDFDSSRAHAFAPIASASSEDTGAA